MNLTKAKILLDKINRLHRSMSLDEDNIAPIEKDLMRDYIKQLYDTFLVSNPVVTPTHTSTSIPVVKRGNAAPKTTYAPPPVRKKVVVATPPPPPPPPPPVIEEIAPPVQEEEPTPSAEKIEKIKPEPVVFKPAVPKPKPTRISAPPPVNIDPEHEELFAQDPKKGELSERLSLTPIQDINQAIGYNERVYNVNELFGADNTFYRNVIKDLNALNSFEEAQAYLSANVASKYDWTSRSKRTVAKKFIKIVRRRYI